jgi:hypothetical protein
MMLVRINRESVKRNPEGWQTSSKIEGPTTMERVVIKHEGNSALRSEYVFHFAANDWVWKRSERIIADDILDLPQETDEVTVGYNYTPIYHSPLPEFLFKYDYHQHTCSNCGKASTIDQWFDHTDEWTYETSYCCPRCKEWLEEDVEFESISDVAKELGL